MRLTKEQLERAAACKSAEELQALAATEGIELTDDEAEAYFAELNSVNVSDEELDAVAGGSNKCPEAMSKTVSRHELVLPLIDDKFILFNGLYGAIDVVDARTADIIRDAQQGDGDPTELDEDVRERLIRRGHLVGRQTESDDLKILSRLKLHCFDQRTVMLVITPTYNSVARIVIRDIDCGAGRSGSNAS